MNNWNSLSDFIYMNGHGYFVWCAYGALLVAVIYEIFSLRAAREPGAAKSTLEM